MTMNVLLWFYVRRCIFIVLLPSTLSLMSLLDFANNSNNKIPMHKHIYFYTSLILCCYSIINYCLTYIFSICANDFIFKKNSDSDLTTNCHDIQFSEISFNNYNHLMVVNKKVYKIKYSKNKLIKIIDKICWALGIESPLLISSDLIEQKLDAKMKNHLINLTFSKIYDKKKDIEEGFHYTLFNSV